MNPRITALAAAAAKPAAPSAALLKLLAPLPPSTHKRHGRRQPYTAIGIERIPCFRCGAPAFHQWQVCADKRLFRPLCLECDIALNRLVLHWMGDPEAASKTQAYAETQKPKP